MNNISHRKAFKLLVRSLTCIGNNYWICESETTLTWWSNLFWWTTSFKHASAIGERQVLPKCNRTLLHPV